MYVFGFDISYNRILSLLKFAPSLLLKYNNSNCPIANTSSFKVVHFNHKI